MTHILTSAPDDPDGTLHTLAPEWVRAAICRRFEFGTPVVLHKTKPNVFIYDPGNFWDGPTHVRWEPECGMFSFRGYGGEQHFPLVGPLA